MQLAKLIMTWDIVPGQEQEYFDFNAREFVPRLMKLGLRPMDSWFRLYGEVPQIVVGWVSEDPEIIRKAFKVAETEKPGAVLVELPEDLAHSKSKGKPIAPTVTRRPAWSSYRK